LKPEVLLNKCIFQDDNLCGDSSNEFFELEEVRNNLLVAGSIMIGGQQKRVSKIMAFKMSWLQQNWIDPIKTLLEKQEREELLRKQREERQRREREDAIRRQREIRQRQERERAAELRRRNEAPSRYQHVDKCSTCVIL
jgi:flagellar motility protein MotE (MotC chaperone)